MAPAGAPPSRWIITLSIAAVVLGIGFRFSNAVHKVYYQDEGVTSLRVAGFTLADYQRLFDGKPHRFGEIQRMLVPQPRHSVGATLHSLASEDPQHPPAFYALAVFWTRTVGSSPLAVRSLSIGLSLLALPLCYALAFELFGSCTIGTMATAFIAVSPFFVLYAYQAREYALLPAAILLSCVLFRRAQRHGDWLSWVAYGLSVAFGMYVYLLFAFVIVAHAVTAAYGARARIKDVAPFLLSAAGGLLLFIPWLRILQTNRAAAAVDVDWATSAYPLPYMLAKWGFYAAASFFDLEYAAARATVVALLVLIVIVLAWIHLVRKQPHGVAVFLLALGGTAFIGLVVPDLILHDRFSTIARYLTPTWLAIVLVVAAYLGYRPASRLGASGFALLLAAAVVSDAVSSWSTSWWENNGNKAVPQLAAVLREHPGLLAVSSQDAVPLLALAPLVPSNAHWLGYDSGTVPRVARDERTYVLSPSRAVRERLSRDARIRLRLVFDSHDFSASLTRFRSGLAGETAGSNDWGEIVLWSIESRER